MVLLPGAQETTANQVVNVALIFGQARAIRRNAKSSPSVQTMIVKGADHNYFGCEMELATAVADWTENLN